MDQEALLRDFPKFVHVVKIFLEEFDTSKDKSTGIILEKFPSSPVDKPLTYFINEILKIKKDKKKTKINSILKYFIYELDNYKKKKNFLSFLIPSENLISIYSKFTSTSLSTSFNGFFNYEDNKDTLRINLEKEMSYPAVVAEIFMTALASPGFTWQASPLVTEMELLMVDWVGQAIGIPSVFLNQKNIGHGALHYTVGEAVALSIICAKTRKIQELHKETNDKDMKNKIIGDYDVVGRTSQDRSSDVYQYFSRHDPKFNHKLRAYTFGKSKLDNNKFGANLGFYVKNIPSNGSTSEENLENFWNILENDEKNGFHPFVLILTIEKDRLNDLSLYYNMISLCKREGLWITVDLSNVIGDILVEQSKSLTNILKDVDGIIANIREVFLTNELCVACWIKNYTEAAMTLSITPTYLRHSNQGMVADLRHLSFGFSKRPRGIRLWMIIRTFGIDGLAKYYKYRNNKNPPCDIINPFDSVKFYETSSDAFRFIAQYWRELKKGYSPSTSSPPLTISKILSQKPPKYGKCLSTAIPIYESLLKNTTQWLHTNFLAYFPCHTNYSCVLGDLFAATFGYRSNMELKKIECEVIETIGRQMNLPQKFWKIEKEDYREWFYGTASEGTFKSVLVGREIVIEKFRRLHFLMANDEIENIDELDNVEKCLLPYLDQWDIHNDPFCCFLYNYLIAYTSSQAHSSVEKGYLLANVRIRKFPVVFDPRIGNFTLKKGCIEEALIIDRKNGLIPFFLTLPVGSTSTCGIDYPEEYAPLAKKENMWVHADAAYLGGFFFLPEMKHLVKGFEYVDSIVINLHKGGCINNDSSMYFLSNRYARSKLLNSLGTFPRMNRAIKIWFVLKSFGMDSIMELQRQQIKCAKMFESLISSKDCLEVVSKQIAGLVTFRLKGRPNSDNEKLFQYINHIDRRLHLTETHTENIHLIRISINNPQMTFKEVEEAFLYLSESCDKFLLNELNNNIDN
ncbi:Histidine decarboxylase [Strongyloides ratti]|uniref:Histidine decarboxylase n=1 Tax=Strongyloides ratti TaxID=34506 RepID=A0A090KX63_STRRB|nr:Histidine decarboxylase [Strongyloides ratti]CEF62090.1 Histidine decarboxylase [Strongyloides ratti]